ncbi:GNAT family N-acetyltransferase [Rhodopila sp.]|uniref:GNAT family N-acetyltransferase n=1 Tax=Rhodopila sp. TaxID=2480087 RepID=UPI003D0D0E4B
MPDGSATLTLTLHAKIAEIDAADWDACAGDGNPFVSHAFLSAMEDSGSANSRTGWLPQHAVLRREDQRVVGIVPMYAKSHSYGEYVFDHGWANALERTGQSYYPKLQVAAPFSPVPGPRLLRRPGSGLPIATLANALEQACQSLGLSSVNVTFCTREEWDGLGDAGWLRRTGMQFHWENDNYADFDGFLGALSSRKRKVLRRERRDANAAGLTFHALSGADITEAHWDAFYRFYHSTVDRKWGSAYLTRSFFSLLGERLGDKVVLMYAENAGRPVAGALNLAGDEALYGRNWGCRGDWPFLHFELCYYRAIDWAIAHGLKRVEAGAQGRHKIQRGYLPKHTYSAHWIQHTGLRRAVASFLQEERAGIEREMAALAEESPFRKGED